MSKSPRTRPDVNAQLQAIRDDMDKLLVDVPNAANSPFLIRTLEESLTKTLGHEKELVKIVINNFFNQRLQWQSPKS